MAKNDVRLRKPKGVKSSSGKSKSDSAKRIPDIDNLSIFLYIAIPCIIVSLSGYLWYMDSLRTRVKTPLDEPSLAEVTSKNMSRFWGTYRSGLYFGTRARTKHSILTGLMWLEQLTGAQNAVRHTCEQGDGLLKYGWREHDGVNFGMQDIVEKNFKITTDFVKEAGGSHGGDWTARITVDTPKKSSTNPSPRLVSLLYYVMSDEAGKNHLTGDFDKGRLASVHGSGTEALGSYTVSFSHTNGKKLNFLSSYVNSAHRVKDVVMTQFVVKSWKQVQYLALKGEGAVKSERAPNLYVYQVTGVVPFSMEVSYHSDSFTSQNVPLTGEKFDSELLRHQTDFRKRFLANFHLQLKVKNGSAQTDGLDGRSLEFGWYAFSNLIGGIGYFYGNSLVQSEYNSQPVEYWAAPLYTAVPSRSFFPRGFLWDEGFHNILIERWDSAISMDIMAHWLDLLNADGWIPREQILGFEARAKVPAEFVVQRDTNANPPTFFLPLKAIVKKLSGSTDPEHKEYLKRLYPRLKTWYNWFNVTQHGLMPFTYQWKGRNGTATRELNPKTLTSGLDDFPRASHPTAKERHVDLYCWMAFASGVMADISQSLGEPHSEYETTRDILMDNNRLNELFWDEDAQQYSDYGLHTDATKLQRPAPPLKKHPGGPPPPRMDKVRIVLEDPSYKLVSSYFGYVNLFPFLLQILKPDSPQLGIILKHFKRPDRVWSPYGLRSLSSTSPLYQAHNTEHDPPYWRGAIWININYLAVDALKHYMTETGPHQELAASLHKDLKMIVSSNVAKQFTSTGFVWEQYSDKNGKGKGCHPFTGWSSLAMLLLGD